MTDQDVLARQLRNHYLATADERPADGQLQAVLERTRATRPHSELAARLGQGTAGRAGLAGLAGLRASLRFTALGAALILVLAAVAVGPGGAIRPATTPFEGRWTSTDHDGSRQLLAVSGGMTPTVSYEDLFASGCADNGDRSTHFFAEGRATISGPKMTVAFPGGGCVTWRVEAYVVDFEHDPATDGLLDNTGIRWRRTP